MNYEDIKASQLKNLAEVDLKNWVIQEIEDLSNDFGNKLDNEMILHIARRLTHVFKNKYRSWYVGDVHAAFQTGLSGAYGTFYKVTVKALFYFLKKTEQQKINNIVTSAEEEIDRATANFNPKQELNIEFITWASKNMICLAHIHPEWNPLTERAVSPKIEALAVEYGQAKDMDVLQSFRNRLRNEYAE